MKEKYLEIRKALRSVTFTLEVLRDTILEYRSDTLKKGAELGLWPQSLYLVYLRVKHETDILNAIFARLAENPDLYPDKPVSFFFTRKAFLEVVTEILDSLKGVYFSVFDYAVLNQDGDTFIKQLFRCRADDLRGYIYTVQEIKRLLENEKGTDFSSNLSKTTGKRGRCV